MERFIIKNKSGTLLSLSIKRFHIRMSPNDFVDLCKATGMSVAEIERHPQIIRNLGYNNIEIILKEGTNIENEMSSDLIKKVDKLIFLMSDNTKQNKITKDDLEEFALTIRNDLGQKTSSNESDVTMEDLKDAIFSMKKDLKNVSINDGKKEQADIKKEDDVLRQELLRLQAESFNPETKNKGSFGKTVKTIETEDLSDLLNDLI